MIGQIQHRRRIGRAGIIDSQIVPIAPGIRDLAGQGPRIPFIARGAGVTEDQAHGLFGLLVTGAPHFFVKADQSSVKVVGTIVDGQLVGLAIEGECPFGDPVGKTPSDTSKKRTAIFVVAQAVESQDDIF